VCVSVCVCACPPLSLSLSQTHARTHGRTDARTHGRTDARTHAPPCPRQQKQDTGRTASRRRESRGSCAASAAHTSAYVSCIRQHTSAARASESRRACVSDAPAARAEAVSAKIRISLSSHATATSDLHGEMATSSAEKAIGVVDLSVHPPPCWTSTKRALFVVTRHTAPSAERARPLGAPPSATESALSVKDASDEVRSVSSSPQLTRACLSVSRALIEP
jgi:hypothetical protein